MYRGFSSVLRRTNKVMLRKPSMRTTTRHMSVFGRMNRQNSTLMRIPFFMSRLPCVGVSNTRMFSQNMYCMQCEQTSGNKGCTAQGICGKMPETSNLQDLLLYVNNGIGECMTTLLKTMSFDEINDKLGEDFMEQMKKLVLESYFATLTNVNFDEDRIADYIHDVCNARDEIKQAFPSLLPATEEGDTSPMGYQFKKNYDDLLLESSNYAGLTPRKHSMQNEDCFGLRETAHYGLKGTMAYFAHAEYMHEIDNSIYSKEERDSIYKLIFECMNDLENLNQDLTFYLSLSLRVGELNVSILELLDRGHNILFGTPEPTLVESLPIEGKCMLISGHDITDVKRILDYLKENGFDKDINVYTHGELLPAHSYPKFKEYGNFIGHFGSAWQNQPWEFRDFPGPIIMTSNCLMPPRRRYKERLFTTNAVGYDSIKHIDLKNDTHLKLITDCALNLKGFNNDTIQTLIKTNDNNKRGGFNKPHLCGFGHSAILGHAGTVVDAIKSGDLKDIFIIGGCDGTEKNRSYFTELAKHTPNESLILTLGCGKYRLKDLDLGNLGETGIPRILDLGQCNDAYSAVVVALKLAEALNTDIHNLPLHFAVSWFEQKAVAIFLSLLHLGIKNIRLGPELPAFLTPNVRDYLTKNLGVKPVNMDDELDDLECMLFKEQPGQSSAAAP